MSKSLSNEGLTLTAVRPLLRERLVTIIRKDGEYRVRLKGSPDGEGYFTTALDDAYATGLHMAAVRDTNAATLRARLPLVTI